MAMRICCGAGLPPPSWLESAVVNTITPIIRQENAKDSRRQQIKQLRWAAVTHFKKTLGQSWDDAYEAAHKELKGTEGKGEPGAMKEAYQQFNRNLNVRRRFPTERSLTEYANGLFNDRQRYLNNLGRKSTRQNTA